MVLFFHNLMIISYNYLGDYMEIGDYVTRNSYNNDIVFQIMDIEDGIYYLKGKSVRLMADSLKDDLVLCDKNYKENEDKDYLQRISFSTNNERNDYFYLPGKILHIDSDKDYLNRCLNYYKKINLRAIGIVEPEESVPYKIFDLLNQYNPSILVITGHDAYYKKKGNTDDLNAYKNSSSFVKAVKEARKYENSHEKLIIIAGACQSDYEDLIKAGANFASSPKRINIHALDPAVIAASMSLSDINKDIDIKSIITKTKYGKEGMGGIITKGTMYTGYPR